MILTAFSVSTLLTVVLLPLAAMLLLAWLLLPAVLAGTARPAATMKAVYCYVLQSVGIVFMTMGALPAVYGVLEKFSLGAERFSAEMYLALLILFSVGGVTFLWHERVAEGIEDAARKIPALLFWYTFKTIGYLLVIYAGLSMLLTMLLVKPSMQEDWWILPLVLLLYGVLLSWCTRTPASTSPGFKMMPMGGKKAVPLAFAKAKRK